jgi:hypothetical protein
MTITASIALYANYKKFIRSRASFWKPKVHADLNRMIKNAMDEPTIETAISKLDANMLEPSGLAITLKNIYVDAGRVWGSKIYQVVKKQAADMTRRARKKAVSSFKAKHPNDKPERLIEVEKDVDLFRSVFAVRTKHLQKAMMPIGYNEDLIAEIISYLRLHDLQMVSEISDTMKTWIMDKLIEGQRNGLSITQVAENITKDSFPANRAIIIARTETVKAANFGAMQAAKKSGFRLEKEWIAARDIRTRRIPRDEFSHTAMNGKTAQMDEAFLVPNRNGSHDSLMQPCDPSGNPADVIQCRCTVGFNVLRGADGLPQKG